MFADALLDSQQLGQSRRGWATLTSFGIQVIAVACLLIVPLYYTQVLPHWKASAPVALPPLGDPTIQQEPSADPAGGDSSVFTVPRADALTPPSQMLHRFDVDGDVRPPAIPFVGPGGGGSPDGVWHGTGDPVARVIMPRHPDVAPPQPKPHISVIMEGHLIHRVDPPYPALARTVGVQGSVVIAAVIGTDGSVQRLQVLSGHPLLVRAARDAVVQWRYRPYILNGSPIEVDTQITVNFILAR